MNTRVAVVILSAVIVVAAAAWVALRAGGGNGGVSATGPAAETFAYQPRQEGELPVLWQAPAFRLTDQEGRPLSLEALDGHPWVANFIFTTCTTVCPTLTAKMAMLQRRLPEPEMRFVSFSVDPAHDTTEVLKAYADRWRPGEPRWHLLRTEPASLARVAAGLRVAVSETDDPDNPIVHSSVFLLADGAGQVRGVYDSHDPAALERLETDARALLADGRPVAEASPAQAGAELYASLGCAACHEQPRLAPSLAGLLGREVELEDGSTVKADAGYVRESIVAPGRRLVAGYLNLMPSYANQVSDREIEALVAHVAALQGPGTAAAAEAPAELAIDPVCGMKVRVTDGTPSARHDGRTWHFCSEMCREHFVRDPEAHLSGDRPKTMPMGPPAN